MLQTTTTRAAFAATLAAGALLMSACAVGLEPAAQTPVQAPDAAAAGAASPEGLTAISLPAQATWFHDVPRSGAEVTRHAITHTGVDLPNGTGVPVRCDGSSPSWKKGRVTPTRSRT